MDFLKKLFGAKPIRNYTDFWNWFQKNEKRFFLIVKKRRAIESVFFRALDPKLKELKDGFFYLVGMTNEDTAELIITADGDINNIVFVEELVAAAPQLERWKFTAHKQASNIDDIGISMFGFDFNEHNLSFYAVEHTAYPDEIDITIVHSEVTEENRNEITQGVYTFLDLYLGELPFIEDIDNLSVLSPGEAAEKLVPINKLKPYLEWRKKEFVEKYDGIKINTDTADFNIFEIDHPEKDTIVALIKMDLLSWDKKASHPWIVEVEINYSNSQNGMPNDKTTQLLNTFELDIEKQLKDSEGYLNIGRETGRDIRSIYFACKEFRKPSWVLYDLQKKQQQLSIKFFIYKDKYWRSFERFEKWYLSSL